MFFFLRKVTTDVLLLNILKSEQMMLDVNNDAPWVQTVVMASDVHLPPVQLFFSPHCRLTPVAVMVGVRNAVKGLSILLKDKLQV